MRYLGQVTNLVERPNSSRGQRRREELVDAGVALLAEGGWPAVTTRAVAQRGGANQGLIHYHFGGLAALRAAIADRAGQLVIGPVADQLLDIGDPVRALDSLATLVRETASDERTGALAVELIAGALREEGIGAALRDQLAEARERLAEQLGGHYPELSEQQRAGWATLLTALVDGLVLHVILDSRLPVDASVRTLRELLAQRWE